MSLHIHDSWSRSLTFMIQIYSKFVKSNHTMIKIWSWLKKDEVEENEKLRKIERMINKSTIIIHSCLHSIISTTSFIWKINNVYMLFTRHHCCHLHQLHIIHTIYNVIYTHYNWRWIIIQLKVSFFLFFLQRFEDFYWELLEWINECTSSFIRVNKNINYWDWEWTHLEEKTIVMMNWFIEIRSETKVRDWVKDQIWVSSESLWLCQDIV